MVHASEAQMAHDWDDYISERDEEEAAEEEWRPLPLFEGLYEVSENGRFRRSAPAARTRVGRLLEPKTAGAGYSVYVLLLNGTPKTIRAHRAVAEAFIGPSNGLPLVRHLDGNPANNHYSNLAWGTHKDNSADMIRHGNSLLGRHQSHCKRGHEMSDDNTSWSDIPSRGQRRRRCLTCGRERERARRARLKED